jgi:ubiquinone/menaquinone biosynthesis C-methylase UbiE
MTAPRPAYTGSMPAFYERYMVPMHFGWHGRVLAGRLADLTSGEILETAAGTGAVTRALVAILPVTVGITATDLNQPMLDLGAALPGLERVRWRQANAQALPFGDETFHAVLCQFGVMFFPDRHAAFAEAWRVLKPGGRLLFSAWDGLENNPLGHIAHQTVFKLFPTLPEESALAPYVYHDRATIEADVSSAGFREIHIEIIAGVSRAGSASDVAYAMCQGGVVRGAIEALGPGRLDEATEAVTRAIAARFGEGPIEARNQALLVTARRL